jgi:hypothetical protein
MLPSRFSATGVYSDRQLDLARGYRVLVHAEMEYYLEESVRDVAAQAFAAWRLDGKPRHTIICLLAFCKRGDREHPIPSTYVGEAIAALRYTLENNNGIKEDNLFKFLLPVGVDGSALNTTWLSSMTSYGTLRGEVAHSSVRANSRSIPSPNTRLSSFSLAASRI